MQRVGRQQNENDRPPPQTQRNLYSYVWGKEGCRSVASWTISRFRAMVTQLRRYRSEANGPERLKMNVRLHIRMQSGESNQSVNVSFSLFRKG